MKDGWAGAKEAVWPFRSQPGQHWRAPQTNAYCTTSQHPAAPAPVPTPQILNPTQAGLGLSLHYYSVF